MAHDPGAYGRSFADVYDDWYAEAPLAAIVAFLGRFVAAGAAVLEIGIGTGRLALPLVEAGYRVSGIDSSPEMLAVLRAKPAGAAIAVTEADAGAAGAFPSGPFDAVLAAFNLVFNLDDRAAQARCLSSAAEVLAADGIVVVEAFVPAPMIEPTRDLVTRSVSLDGVVLIATETDPAAAAVRGAHIELTTDSVRVRPWRICVATPDELDELAAGAGLTLVERVALWSGDEFVAGHSDHHVSVYRR